MDLSIDVRVVSDLLLSTVTYMQRGLVSEDHLASYCVDYYISSILSCQVCLDPEQSPEWVDENQRLSTVLALHHSTWDTKL